MTEMPSTYQGTVLSARSRRLRTIGLLLLLGVVAMTVYGMTALMPPLRQAGVSLAQQEKQLMLVSQPLSASSKPVGEAAKMHLASLRHKLKVQVAVAYAYWGVCALLLIAVLFVAWLDLREISRNYLNQRRAIWSEALPRGPASEE